MTNQDECRDKLISVLIKYRYAQRAMRDKWADGDKRVKSTLWKNLHACEILADNILNRKRE